MEIILGLMILIEIELLNIDIDWQIWKSNRFHKMVRNGKMKMGDKNFMKYKNAINKMRYDRSKIRNLKERWDGIVEGS